MSVVETGRKVAELTLLAVQKAARNDAILQGQLKSVEKTVNKLTQHLVPLEQSAYTRELELEIGNHSIDTVEPRQLLSRAPWQNGDQLYLAHIKSGNSQDRNAQDHMMLVKTQEPPRPDGLDVFVKSIQELDHGGNATSSLRVHGTSKPDDPSVEYTYASITPLNQA